ncbi:cysteine desulfurase [Iamia sp. SCSIO 61187]|nr:cysteine desulfurase [Iamia sp. SCSIO 61187]
MRPEAVAAMVPFLAEHYGNPSGSHAAARHARRAVDDARDAVAALVGCRPGEVVFTSAGTEADVTALTGVAAARPGPVAVSAIEHAAVLDTARALAAAGTEVVELAVDGRGRVDPDAVPAGAALVSVGLANNEVGTIHPLEALAERGAVLHTDAVQAAAWLDLPRRAAPAALVSLSAHKLGGPKGVGALVVRDGTPLAPLLTGGGQERGRRSGTQNVAGIVAFGVAAALAADEREAKAARVARLRDRLAAGLLPVLRGLVPDAVETVVPPGGDRDHVLPGHLHLCLPGAAADEVLFLLDQAGVAATAASSCASGATAPSHVLAALGVDVTAARGSLRLTLGWSTTDADVDRALEAVPAAVARAVGAPPPTPQYQGATGGRP